MRYYELMIVVSPQVDEEGISTTLDRMNSYVSQHGGSVVRQERWGQLRRLAYPIRNYNEGNYVLTHLEMEPEDTKALEASILLSENVLRHLLVRIEAIPPAKPEPAAPVAQAAEVVSTEGPAEVGEEVSQEASVAVVEEEPQPAAEAQAAVVEEEPQPAAETQPAAVEEEPQPAAEAQAAVVEEEPQPTAEAQAAVVEEEPQPAAEAQGSQEEEAEEGAR